MAESQVLQPAGKCSSLPAARSFALTTDDIDLHASQVVWHLPSKPPMLQNTQSRLRDASEIACVRLYSLAVGPDTCNAMLLVPDSWH